MRRSSEQGYILASTLSALLAMSLVLASMVSVSVDGLRRAKSAERRVAGQLAVDSAVLLLAVELAEDPRRRSLAISDAGEGSITIGDRRVAFKVSWEALLLDLNRADPADIDRALEEAGASPAFRARIGGKLSTSRAGDRPIRLVDDLTQQPDELACLNGSFTVFGGQSKPLETDPHKIPIGQPAPGSILRLDVSPSGAAGGGRTMVILMTGNPEASYRTLDVRPLRSTNPEVCHDV